MRRTRAFWISVIVVAALVAGSLVGLVSGKLSPTLGLDLEGGVSVILSAPSGTTTDVMERALENIRNRVDAFGVGEPDIFLSGTTIEIQIPGAGRGTIEQRQGEKFCLVGEDGTNYGCSDDRTTASNALDELDIQSQPTKVCLVDGAGKQLACYDTATEAEAAKSSLQIKPKGSSSPSPSGSASASPSASPSSGPPTGFCLDDSTGKELACFDSTAEAQAAQSKITTKVVESSFCVVAVPAPTPTPSPSASSSASPSATSSPSKHASASSTASPSGSPSASGSSSPSPPPTPKPGYADLDRSGAQPLPCGLKTKDDATSAIDAISVPRKTIEYCVVSSGGQDFGCFIDQAAAVRRQQETGQERLLKVIGETARLEERQVLAIVPPTDPSYASLQVTCGTPEERDTPACGFDALRNKQVVYLDGSGNKYSLGPIVISGDQFTSADAVLPAATQTSLGGQWEIQFALDGTGSKAFADATAKAVTLPQPQNQIAIVVDRGIISSPVVQSEIPNGRGQITGGFTEQEAKDLATQLQAGALPVELTRQSVQTVSPTLGEESLRQGVIAGAVGLILLFLYMLFYYRLLGVVAWLGMSIWAVLAIALVSIAGREFGYALTLAGVAGLVISLGITADSYIVFFERLKDEARRGRSIRSIVKPAFKRAFRTIVAADIVTGIAAAVLYLTAVSSVRGFALTLGVATLLDLFVVYFFKRPTVFLLANSERLVGLRGFGLRSSVAADLPHEGAPDGVER